MLPYSVKMSLFDKPKREAKKKSAEDYFDFVEYDAFKRLSNTVKELKDELSEVKGEMGKMAKKHEELEKELNRKDVELNELAAEVNSLKGLTKDMGGSVVQQENEIKKVQQQAELVMKANSIVENNKLIEEKMEETNNLVQTYKEDIKKTFAEILKEKEEIKHQRVEKR